MAQSGIIFTVEESAEGGFEARVVGHPIFTQADTLEELKVMLWDAVACHFDAGMKPAVILLYRAKVADLLAEMRSRPGKEKPGDLWWGCLGEPTRGEIDKAIQDGDFNPEINDGDKYPGNRKRHVARIAYLVQHPAELERPVWVSHGCPCGGYSLMVEDGAHRLLAHNYLEKEFINVYEFL